MLFHKPIALPIELAEFYDKVMKVVQSTIVHTTQGWNQWPGHMCKYAAISMPTLNNPHW